MRRGHRTFRNSRHRPGVQVQVKWYSRTVNLFRDRPGIYFGRWLEISEINHKPSLLFLETCPGILKGLVDLERA